jgi:hypothetical protein
MTRKLLVHWLLLLFVSVPLARPLAPSASRQPGQSSPPDAGRHEEDLWSPANPTSGGLVFLVNPADASIYVDGTYAGRPSVFTPLHPLTLEAGQHRLEFAATGYATLRVDVAVVAGFVTPVQAVMERW